MRRRWAALAARMRCSRRSGVVLYRFANGCFAAYTSPPPTAEPLLKEKPFGECISKRSPIAARRSRNYSMHSRGTPILIGAGLAKPDHRGKRQKRAGGACSRPSDSSFSLPRGAAVPPSIFINLTFASHAAFFDSFLGSKKESYLSFPPLPADNQQEKRNHHEKNCRALSGSAL